MRTKHGSFWHGRRSFGSPSEDSVVEQTGGVTGGGHLVEYLVSGGREVRLDLPHTDASKEGTVSIIGISNEEKIMWSKVGKEVLDTKATVIG